MSRIRFQNSKPAKENLATRSECNVKVLCRFRPILHFEQFLSKSEVIHCISPKVVGVGELNTVQTFTFDKIFPPSSSQDEIFEYIGKPTISDIITGYNGTILAYGQTGSGKTFTMMGDLNNEKNFGIVPRSASEIFKLIEQDTEGTEFIIKCSMLEIYKDNLLDLLANKSDNLKIKEDPIKGVYVQGLSFVSVTSPKELVDIIVTGDEIRTVASTKMNECSSRSHLLVILEVFQRFEIGCEKKGILNFVDLAGSEKISNSGVTGNNLEEAKKINLSLSALGKVISALAICSEHVPFRDSKLTRILQDSLSGNFKTSLIVNCSSSALSVDETLNSLNFAVRAKAIKNKVKINLQESSENYAKTIDLLRNELILAKQEIISLKEKSIQVENKTVYHTFNHPPTKRSKKSLTTLVTPNPKVSGNNTFNFLTVSTLESTNFDKKIFCTDDGSIYSSFLSHDKVQEESCNFKGIEEYCKDHERIISKLKEDISDLQTKYQIIETKLKMQCEKNIEIQEKSLEYYSLYHKTLVLINKDSAENALLKKKNEELTKSINNLLILLQNFEKKHNHFVESIRDKDNTHIEFMDTLEILKSPIETDLGDFLDSEEGSINFKLKSLSISSEDLLKNNIYRENVKNALENNLSLSKDILIFQLKNQIVQASLINSNLYWKIESLNLKNNLLQRKFEIKNLQNTQLKEQVYNLERIVDCLHKNSGKIKKQYSEKSEIFSPTPNLKILRSFIAKSTRPLLEGTEKSFASSLFQPSLDFDGELISAKLKNLEFNLNIQKLSNIHLKNAYLLACSEAEKTKNLMENSLKEQEIIFCNEKIRWTKAFHDTKENCEKELIRKQDEVKKLNELLAEWIDNYMVIQEGLVTRETHTKIQKLIIETVKFYSATEKINQIFSKTL